MSDERIAELEAQLAEADEVAARLRAQIAILTRERDEILTSGWWRIGNRMVDLRNRVAPRGTRRGAAAARLTSLLRIWGGEGVRGVVGRVAGHGRHLSPTSLGEQADLQPAAPPPSRVPGIPTVLSPPPPSSVVKPVPLLDVFGASPAELAARLRFAAHVRPVVSVIVPVRDNIDLTLRCLTALATHTQTTPFEVIVADDGSSAATTDLLSSVPNLRYLRKPASAGSVHASNRGASEARGDYLLFLNDDTEVQKQWLDPLVEAFAADPRTGMAGSKLVSPSGHLQEAGVVLRKDGSAELVGLDDGPAKPEFNRKREVDHCSRASVLIPRALFAELGGFDEAYAPASFEDCDLSLKVRRSGRKVVYVPDSVVLRQRSLTTAGTDGGVETGPIDTNRRLLIERWGSTLAEQQKVRAIAFYLPQYHPIPENDAWWGKGFTEWRYVARARPVYEGHHQPQLPADLGFYDLRLPEAREAQADLARSYGIHGFCYYYYWFNGKRLLERPLTEVLQSGKPDFPFCVCWANENWTRRWDGLERDVLIAQKYSPEDDRAFIEALLPYLADRRYIRVDGRPLLLLYRAGLLPDVRATLTRWRDVSKAAGMGDLYLAAVQSFHTRETPDPRREGFDAAVEFPPHGFAEETSVPGRMTVDGFTGRFYDYAATARNYIQRPMPGYPLLRTAMPSWDNTPRRPLNSDSFPGASPELYEQWLRRIVDQTRHLRFGDERMVFVNAWNEWGEGNHLEPDLRHGRAYLEATQRGLELQPQPARQDAPALTVRSLPSG